jgi:hypothetical protein
MLDKARIAFQIKKLQKIRGDRDLDGGTGVGGTSGTEKCMVMSDISVKRPMRVLIMNKSALKILGYS